MSKRTPSALTLDFLAKGGWSCWNVEKRLPIPGKYVTQDCYHFADILAYKPGRGIALVQTTSTANHAARKRKILDNPHARGWCMAGGRILLISWGDKGERMEEITWVEVAQRNVPARSGDKEPASEQQDLEPESLPESLSEA